MKWFKYESHHAKLFAIRGSLGLLILFPLLGHDGSSAAGQSSQAAWEYTLKEEGAVSAKPLLLDNTCQLPVNFRVDRKGSFIRLMRPVDSIVVNPGSKVNVGVTLDAKGLKGNKAYRGKIIVKCLDCKKQPRCGIKEQSELGVVLHVVKPTSTTRAGKAESARIVANLVRELKSLSAFLNDKVLGLEKVTGLLPGGTSETGYDAREFVALIEDVRRRLLGAMENEKLDALKEYAIKYLPLKSALPTVIVMTEEAAAASPGPWAFSFAPSRRPHAFRGPLKERLIVTAASANASLNSIRGLLARLEANADPITLRVISVPEGANIKFETMGGKEKYKSGTNGNIDNFFRGIYRITVSKTGYLNIVHDSQEVGFGNIGDGAIECQLVTSGEAILCKFR